ncbi:helix-turn-helix domain-containing protein [Halobacteriaceae archaeon SHR40]|uniref:helix-turn-helix domain-containing protein n=1 Tax=Halovenus amylolytica TaxID=2500550 RepID=UPI000FE30F44
MAPNGTSADRARLDTRSTELLRARLAIDVHPDSHFGVVSESGDAEVLNHQLKLDPSAGEPSGNLATDGECHSVLFYPETDRQEYVVTRATDHCISTVFATEHCLAEPKSVSDGVVTVRVVAPRKQTFKRVLGLLADCGAEVSVKWLLNGKQGRLPVKTDVAQITDKQREAIETALEKGYYENPRQASLSDLAEELGVTDSAVSQRLGAAETKLVKSLFEP